MDVLSSLPRGCDGSFASVKRTRSSGLDLSVLNKERTSEAFSECVCSQSPPLPTRMLQRKQEHSRVTQVSTRGWISVWDANVHTSSPPTAAGNSPSSPLQMSLQLLFSLFSPSHYHQSPTLTSPFSAPVLEPATVIRPFAYTPIIGLLMWKNDRDILLMPIEVRL